MSFEVGQRVYAFDEDRSGRVLAVTPHVVHVLLDGETAGLPFFHSEIEAPIW